MLPLSISAPLNESAEKIREKIAEKTESHSTRTLTLTTLTQKAYSLTEKFSAIRRYVHIPVHGLSWFGLCLVILLCLPQASTVCVCACVSASVPAYLCACVLPYLCFYAHWNFGNFRVELRRRSRCRRNRRRRRCYCCCCCCSACRRRSLGRQFSV